MMTGKTVLVVCLLLALTLTAAASKISLTAHPSVVQDGLTDTLTLTCSLVEVTKDKTKPTKNWPLLESKPGTERGQNDTGIPGNSGVSNTSVDVEYVNSIIVFRGSAQTKTPVARIIGPNPAEAITDKENLKVQGVLSPNVSSDPEFLELKWTNPREEQEGEYSCEVHGLDMLGRPISLEAKIEVKVRIPGNRALVTEIINLENRMATQEKSIKEMESLIIKALHIEQGKVYFEPYKGGAEIWPIVARDYRRRKEKVVRFQTPYTNIPVVITRIMQADFDNNANIRYDCRAKDVSKDGFKIVCDTWFDSFVFLLGIRWTSFAA